MDTNIIYIYLTFRDHFSYMLMQKTVMHQWLGPSTNLAVWNFGCMKSFKGSKQTQIQFKWTMMKFHKNIQGLTIWNNTIHKNIWVNISSTWPVPKSTQLEEQDM